MSQVPNVFEEFLLRYGPKAGEEGPVLFVREVLGAVPDPWQESVLRAFGRGERRISIRACHGPGKTAVAAWLVILMLVTRFPQKTVATAPSRGQLEDALVSEVMAWGLKLPKPIYDLYEWKTNRVELKGAPDESFFSARTARAESPEALQGVHSDNVLLIGDEASGIPEPIFESAAGSMSGHNATTLLLSNPTRTSGFFFDTHHKLRDMWFTVHVSYKDSPRVTEDFAYDMARRYGEDSNAYRIRALGEFPKADEDTIIPYYLVDSARNRDIVMSPRSPEVWGLDVARFGDDDTVLIRRNTTGVLPKIEIWHHLNTMQVVGKVKERWDDTPADLRPSEILVDVIGIGGGVVDRLQELGLPARGVNVSESPATKEKYVRLRDELWFKAREWLESLDHTLPRCEGGCANACPHERLAQELVILKYGVTSSGKLVAEAKSDLKKRGYKSPNVADAFVLTFAGEPATMVHGSQGGGWSKSWNEPIHRDVAVV